MDSCDAKLVSEEKTDPKCPDGNRPLLDENLQVFSCQRRCPDTFYCEHEHCCPNTTAISLSLSTTAENQLGIRDKKNIQFQLESSAEFEKTLSCERFPYKISCKNTTTSQPLTKWYFDIQTLSCELYPFGMCEDDPLDKLALRTREECEERCDVANVKQALGDLNGNVIGSENIEKEPPIPLIRVPNASQIAIDDVIQESKHIRGRPFAIEPPTDLLHVIHVKSDSDKLRKREKIEKISEKLIEIDENQLLTTSTVDQNGGTVPTVTSDILQIFEEPMNDDGDVEIQEGSGELGTIKITFEIERQQRSQSIKSMEDSFEQFYQRNRESVSCSATPYRLLCSSGVPSQFVYRWEKVGGVCQSFPYGYCLKEKNVPHPRTKAECEQFCD